MYVAAQISDGVKSSNEISTVLVGLRSPAAIRCRACRMKGERGVNGNVKRYWPAQQFLGLDSATKVYARAWPQ